MKCSVRLSGLTGGGFTYRGTGRQEVNRTLASSCRKSNINKLMWKSPTLFLPVDYLRYCTCRGVIILFWTEKKKVRNTYV